MSTRFEAAAERGLTPYVSRGRELDRLRHNLEKVEAGLGQEAYFPELSYRFKHAHLAI